MNALKRDLEETDEVLPEVLSLLLSEVHLIQDIVTPIQQQEETVLHTSTDERRERKEHISCGGQAGRHTST